MLILGLVCVCQYVLYIEFIYNRCGEVVIESSKQNTTSQPVR